MTIEELCKQYKISNYKINDDNSIDVFESVVLSEQELTELPLKFNEVHGDFYCQTNDLTTLKK